MYSIFSKLKSPSDYNSSLAALAKVLAFPTVKNFNSSGAQFVPDDWYIEISMCISSLRYAVINCQEIGLLLNPPFIRMAEKKFSI